MSTITAVEKIELAKEFNILGKALSEIGTKISKRKAEIDAKLQAVIEGRSKPADAKRTVERLEREVKELEEKIGPKNARHQELSRLLNLNPGKPLPGNSLQQIHRENKQADGGLGQALAPNKTYQRVEAVRLIETYFGISETAARNRLNKNIQEGVLSERGGMVWLAGQLASEIAAAQRDVEMRDRNLLAFAKNNPESIVYVPELDWMLPGVAYSMEELAAPIMERRKCDKNTATLFIASLINRKLIKKSENKKAPTFYCR